MAMLSAGQGGYFLATGLWPLVHMPSFEAATGSKTDDWLVKTVGVLVAAIGATLCVSARRGVPSEIALLAILSAAGLAAIDIVYSLGGVISGVYLLDAVVQVISIVAWVGLMATASGRRRLA